MGYRLAQHGCGLPTGGSSRSLPSPDTQYDSSVRLLFRTYADERWRQFPYRTMVARTAVPRGSALLHPDSGLRCSDRRWQLLPPIPAVLVRRAVAYWDRHYPSPYVMYFHTWELDPDQPRVNGVPCSQQVRQYRNLSKMPSLVRDYLRTYRFTSIAKYFQLEQPVLRTEARAAAAPSRRASGRRARRHSAGDQPLTAVTVVVPCYNEEQSLPYLANTLRSVVAEWADRYRFNFVFVDDCSTDLTWRTLQATFATRSAARCCGTSAIREWPRPSRPGSARRRPISCVRSIAIAPTIPTTSAG